MEKYKEWIQKYPGIVFLIILSLVSSIAIGFCVIPSITLFALIVLVCAVFSWGLVMLMVNDGRDCW